MFALFQVVHPVALAAGLDQNVAAAVVCAVILGALALAEWALSRSPISAAARDLGLGRPPARPVLATGLLCVAMLGFYPAYAAATGASISIVPDWPWVLLGLFLLHGVAEEALFRGFVYRRLRVGRSFLRAGAWSMVLFALAHTVLFFQFEPAIATASVLLAVANAYPLAHAFEQGARTVWTPAMIHTMAHSIALVRLPEENFAIAAALWMAVYGAASFLVFLPVFGKSDLSQIEE
jgi:membrane protease YdiL (CAAX protease family)